MPNAKKSLGQHFLHNTVILQKIVAAAEITADDVVIEVGPGTGTLTDELVKTGAYIVAIEKDEQLGKLLQKKYERNKRVKIIIGDILTFDHSLEIENWKLKILFRSFFPRERKRRVLPCDLRE